VSSENSCGCGCKQLSEADIRRIVREEVTATLALRVKDAVSFETVALMTAEQTEKLGHQIVENFNRGRRDDSFTILGGVVR